MIKNCHKNMTNLKKLSHNCRIIFHKGRLRYVFVEILVTRNGKKCSTLKCD